MKSPFLAPSLVGLRAEINARWPSRDKTSDGWIGDAAHSARESDHNPDDNGMVHAIDVDKDGIEVAVVLAATIGDPRVNYVIHDRVIYSRVRNFRPVPYTGSNPHTKHIHISILYTAQAEQGSARWLEDEMTPADFDKIRAIVREEVINVLTNERLVANLPLDEGKAQGRNWTYNEVLAALDKKTDLQGRIMNAVNTILNTPKKP